MLLRKPATMLSSTSQRTLHRHRRLLLPPVRLCSGTASSDAQTSTTVTSASPLERCTTNWLASLFNQQGQVLPCLVRGSQRLVSQCSNSSRGCPQLSDSQPHRAAARKPARSSTLSQRKSVFRRTCRAPSPSPGRPVRASDRQPNRRQRGAGLCCGNYDYVPRNM